MELFLLLLSLICAFIFGSLREEILNDRENICLWREEDFFLFFSTTKRNLKGMGGGEEGFRS